MRASELMKDWPDCGPNLAEREQWLAKGLAEREERIVQAVRSGFYQPIEWQPMEVERMGHRGKIWVARDALRIGEPGDSVRVNVSARTAQRIADMVGASLPTTFVLDEVQRRFQASVPPQIQPPDRRTREDRGMSPWMDDLGAMRLHSAQVDQAIARLSVPPYIVCNVGKHWVITSRLANTRGMAANYGWYTPSAPYVSTSGIKLWQSLGTRHNDRHVDYSQVLQLVRGTMEVDGQAKPFERVAVSPTFWGLVSDEGPLKCTRIQSVPVTDPVPTPSSGSGFTEDERSTIETELEELVTLFMEAKNYTRVDRSSSIKYVVLHTAEIGETLTSAEALARWCAGPSAPRASWHFAVDADSITQSVREEYIAWHAPGANQTGIGIELAGRASQLPEQWNDDFSRATLERASRLVSYLCHRWNLPVQFVSADGLRCGLRGITTHAEVTKAFGKSTHTDPGKHFPVEAFLDLVRNHQRG